MNKISKIKYLLFSAIGLGIGGIFFGWGWHNLFSRGQEANEFLIIFGIVFFCLLSNLSLVAFLNDIKIFRKIFIILEGAFVWLIAFCVWFIGLFIFGVGSFASDLTLPPGLILVFFIPGTMIALFYILTLKTKPWPVIWRGGVGFALALLIGLISENLITNYLFSSFILADIISFSLAGVVLGLFLSSGIYKGKKDIKIGGQKEGKPLI